MSRQPAAYVGASGANPSALLDRLALDPAHIKGAERVTLMGTHPFQFFVFMPCFFLDLVVNTVIALEGGSNGRPE